MTIPPAVLAAYPDAVQRCRWVPLPPGGGLSGGRVWRGEVQGVPLFALKRWPAGFTAERMTLVHERMHQVADLDFVPGLTRTRAGNALVADAYCWDVTAWMPGTVLTSYATTPGVMNAVRALATLHHRWQSGESSCGRWEVIPRMLSLLARWRVARLDFTGAGRAEAELSAACAAIARRFDRTVEELTAYQYAHGGLRPLHGDFWPQNVLFVGDRVSAVLDYGNVHTDRPERDVARLLADFVPLTHAFLYDAKDVYESANPGVELSVPFLQVLIDRGRVCSLARWLLRVNTGEVAAADALPRVRRLVWLMGSLAGSGTIPPPPPDAGDAP